ncbi:MAG: response regulator [Pseudomonadota bacterium]
MEPARLPGSAPVPHPRVFQLGLEQYDAFILENLFFLHPGLAETFAWGRPDPDGHVDIVFVDGDSSDSLNALVDLRRRQPDVMPIFLTRRVSTTAQNCLRKPLAGADVVRVISAVSHLPVAARPARAALPTPPVTVRILIADQDLAELRLLHRTLGELVDHSLGIAIELATSGHEAIAQATQGNYDLVLLDAALNEPDGYATCRLIRKNSDVRIAMLLKQPTPEDHLAAHQAGCQHCLAKPANDKDLRAIVRLAALRKMVAAPTTTAHKSSA